MLFRSAGGFFPPEHWAGHDRLTGYDFDPVRARALLAEAGGLDRPLRMEYKTSSDRFRQRIAVVIQDQLRDVGIEVTVASHEWGTFYGDIKFSEAGNNIAKPMVLRQIQNGVFNVVAPSKWASHGVEWPRVGKY